MRQIYYILISVIVVFAGVEILSRIFLPYNQSFDERMYSNIEYIPSGYSRMLLKPNQAVYALINHEIDFNKIKYIINSMGYRGSNIGLQKAQDTIRIVVIGGSHVFDPNSYDYNGDYGFPGEIEQIMQAKGRKVEVINAGIPGIHTFDIIPRLNLEIRKLKPDYVIINSIWNDLKWITSSDTIWSNIYTPPMAVDKNPLGEPVNLWDHIFGGLVSYRKVRDFYWLKKLNVSYTDSLINEQIGNSEMSRTAKRNYKSGLIQYRHNIEQCIALVKDFGATPILAIEETLIASDNTKKARSMINYEYVNSINHDNLVSVLNGCQKTLEEIASVDSVLLIDANKFVAGNIECFSDHVHTTPKGSEIIAGEYAEILLNYCSDN